MKSTWCLALLLLVGCSDQIRVYSDHDPEYNLWSYKTFNWGQKVNIEEGRNPLYYNELNDKRIKTAVQDQMTERGFILSEDNPDLIIHYHIIVDDQSVVYTDSYGHDGPYWTHLRTNVYAYTEGTLIIDLMDWKMKNLIWRGWAESAIDVIYGPKEIDRLIKTAVSKIFKKFPKPVADERNQNLGFVFNERSSYLTVITK